MLLCACGASPESQRQEGAQVDAVQPAPNPQAGSAGTTLTGLLQSSGLSAKEAHALGLGTPHYQLLTGKQAFFLTGHDSLKTWLGHCLSLKGQQKDWETVKEKAAEQTTYGRLFFVVEAAKPQAFGACYFPDTLSAQAQGREVQYSGKIKRMQRPAPDIAYDYSIALQEPYRDPNHPIEPGMLVKKLPLFTGSFELLQKLEEAVRENNSVQIQGRQQQGYAEQEAVWVFSVD